MILNSATNHPTPSFLIWRMTSHADEAQCVVNVGPLGLEVQYILNGSMLYSYRFDRADEVLSWTTTKQLTLQKRGWERM
jgi:hypothetical protein